jgi:hypothetical protein
MYYFIEIQTGNRISWLNRTGDDPRKVHKEVLMYINPRQKIKTIQNKNKEIVFDDKIGFKPGS